MKRYYIKEQTKGRCDTTCRTVIEICFLWGYGVREISRGALICLGSVVDFFFHVFMHGRYLASLKHEWCLVDSSKCQAKMNNSQPTETWRSIRTSYPCRQHWGYWNQVVPKYLKHLIQMSVELHLVWAVLCRELRAFFILPLRSLKYSLVCAHVGNRNGTLHIP